MLQLWPPCLLLWLSRPSGVPRLGFAPKWGLPTITTRTCGRAFHPSTGANHNQPCVFPHFAWETPLYTGAPRFMGPRAPSTIALFGHHHLGVCRLVPVPPLQLESISHLRDAFSPGLAPHLRFTTLDSTPNSFHQLPADYPDFSHHACWYCTTSGRLFAWVAIAQCVVGFIFFVGLAFGGRGLV